MPPSVSAFGGLVFGNGVFLALANGEEFWSSSDGIAWTRGATLGGSGGLQTIAAGEGVFFAFGGDRSILYQSGPLERLGNPRRLPGLGLEWTVTGAPFINYRLEFSEDLLNWQTLARVTNAPPTYSFTDPGAANRGGRFYRVVTE